MPSIGDAGGLDKGVEEAGIVGDLVEPAPGSELGAITERAYAVAESGPGQNGDVPHQKQGPGVHPDQSSSHGIGFAAAGGDPGANVGSQGQGPHGGPAGAVQCDAGRLGRKPWRSAGGDDGHTRRGGGSGVFDHALKCKPWLTHVGVNRAYGITENGCCSAHQPWLWHLHL